MHATVSLARLRFADYLRPHDVVGWPQGPGEPLALTRTLVAQRSELKRPTLFFGLSSSDTLRPELAEHFAFRALNGAGSNRRVTALADIVPCHVSSIATLLRSGALRVDVVLIQVRSLPSGGFTLGVIADFTQALIEQARVVIALVNPALPATRGDACVDSGDIDILVENDSRVIDMPDPEPSPVERTVAAHVAALIPDRSTVQLGIGTLPAAVARALSNHRELGVHSGVVSDALVDLVERGVVNGSRKERNRGKIVTAFLMGTSRLYAFVDDNPMVEMRSVDFTNDTHVIRSFDTMTAINSAIEVDLSGQVVADSIGPRIYSGVGGQMDFIRGAARAANGRAIIALPSTAARGTASRIVPMLTDGAGVVTTRAHVRTIVTEWGVAELFGKSLRERAAALIAVAHPDHRERLEAEARRLRLD